MKSVINVNELLKSYDKEFIEKVYSAILCRTADAHGMNHYLHLLRSGLLRKFDIIVRLRLSPEGRRQGVRLAPFGFNVVFSVLRQTPVIGWLFFVLIDFIRLPFMLRPVQAELADVQKSIAQHNMNNASGIDERFYALDQRTLRIVNSLDNAVEIFSVINKKVENLEIKQQDYMVKIDTLYEAVKKDITETKHKLLIERSVEMTSLREELAAVYLKKIEDTVFDITKMREEQIQSAEILQSLHDVVYQDKNFTQLPAYAAFEDIFRGPESLIYDRGYTYLPVIEEIQNRLGEKFISLDLGSGRGEWLRFLTERGYKCIGVENNPLFVDRSRGHGMQVHQCDFIDFLRQQPPNVFGLISAFHLVEHISPAGLVAMLEQCQRTLVPGGLLILETPNIMNMHVSMHSFFTDLTHKMPIVPETLEFFVKTARFCCVQGYFMCGDGKGRTLMPREGHVFDSIESLCTVSGDFALIGKKI